MKSKIDPPHKLPIKWSASPLHSGVMITARLEIASGNVVSYNQTVSLRELELSNFLIVPMMIADMTALLVEYAEDAGI